MVSAGGVCGVEIVVCEGVLLDAEMRTAELHRTSPRELSPGCQHTCAYRLRVGGEGEDWEPGTETLCVATTWPQKARK